MKKEIAAVYVIKPEFLPLLSEELDNVSYATEDLIFSSHKKRDVCFAQDIWLKPQKVTFQSISEAVRILRQAGKFWYLHPISHIRRSRLIEEQLRKLPPLLRHFPIESEIPSIGAFSLLDNNTLIYSAKRQKKWPQGKCDFIEDKINPPNRAYLKLWEALTLLGEYPKPGDKALDLGASPGGWTYVLHSLGASVTAVDKALLDPKIAQLPRVTTLQQSAFALEPAQLAQNYDWVLSDVACYPDRAYALIMKWIESEKAKQMIFTIKLQGKIELSTLKQFQKIPNSFLTNMFYNKHEVTFFYPFMK
ncbi:SAM-dependent methyltransferase [Legionella parisiensis]|uniref:Ribosomal RNA large subunit methyltransferase M n=1 Tax=Legionella parisiensis TaxID=45071 RepID=A0A1E5JLQ8_9GAMM|nr:SAM-dependent methyltransferase [Legionella parisiensis]KTD41327.1 methyltransferase [Legionella parisiensis]OEH45487.1 Ribosomal RNA large subunit methyltransferase M [Legionella parisiensis]STX76372.1 methyltransferase [Legionella parisiensis]